MNLLNTVREFVRLKPLTSLLLIALSSSTFAASSALAVSDGPSQACLDLADHAETTLGALADIVNLAALYPDLLVDAATAGFSRNTYTLERVTEEGVEVIRMIADSGRPVADIGDAFEEDRASCVGED
jgi:hypothetical protein